MLMPEYRVRYDIDVDADDPKAAVALAWELMHAEGSTATIFEVLDVAYTDLGGVEEETLTHITYYEASTMREVVGTALGVEYKDDPAAI
jgi:hypothetical protein